MIWKNDLVEWLQEQDHGSNLTDHIALPWRKRERVVTHGGIQRLHGCAFHYTVATWDSIALQSMQTLHCVKMERYACAPGKLRVTRKKVLQQNGRKGRLHPVCCTPKED